MQPVIKAIRVIFILLTFCGTAFAGKPVPALPEAGKITNPVACQTDASQTYAVYVPLKGNKDALPVIYMFDPHGDGALPLTKYRSLADEYGFILVGSNNSKNGNNWQTTEYIWQHLFEDTQKRLKINGQRMYTCGFSGGAKVAGYIALKYTGIKSVIAGGAGLPDGTPAGNFAFSFTGIAGEGDMNMADLQEFCNQLDNTTTKHRMIMFSGKHEWAPASTMAVAFAGLQFDAMRQGAMAKSDSLVSHYVAQSKQRFTLLNQAKQLLKAAQECNISLSYLDGISNDAAWFKKQLTALKGTSLYQSQLQQQQVLLNKEQTIKAGYMQQLQQGNMQYWTQTISGLESAASEKTSEGAMNQRLLAWLSLAFYSISNQLITNNQNANAQHFVDLYKLADPTNSEAWYFSAMLNARGQHAQATEADLQKAVSCGFMDKPRMEQQPEFKSLRINFSAIEQKMK